MIPASGSSHLRKGRASIRGQYYLLTTSTHKRQKFFGRAGAAQIDLDSLHYLNKVKIIDLQAAVVMPDHLHFVTGLNSGTLSGWLDA